MDTTNLNPQGGAPNVSAPAAQPPAAAGAPPDTQLQLPDGVTVQGDRVKIDAEKPKVVSKRTFQKIMGEFMDRGKKEGTKEFAQSLGFSSVEEMRTAALRGKGVGSGGGDRPRDTNRDRDRDRNNDRRDNRDRNTRNDRNDRRDARDKQQLERERQQREEAERRARAEERRRKDAERDARATEGRFELMNAARAAGCNDPDYAVELLHREMSSMTRGKRDSEIRELVASFDEEKWFSETLKKQKPHLFVGTVAAPTERKVPLTTGTGTGADDVVPPAPKAPTETQVRNADAVNGGPGDARKMNPTEYKDLTDKLGLRLDG